MKVRLKIAWQFWPKGHVFDAMPAAQAQVMVAAGQAEYVADEPAPPPRPTGYVDRQARPARRRRA